MGRLHMLIYRSTQEKNEKQFIFNANRNCLKCAFLHTLIVKTGGGGGLTFFGQYSSFLFYFTHIFRFPNEIDSEII